MNKHTLFVIIATSIWIGETVYFGYNEHPKSAVERILDIVATLFVVWGIAGDVARHIQWHNNHYGETNVQKANFYFKDGQPINFQSK